MLYCFFAYVQIYFDLTQNKLVFSNNNNNSNSNNSASVSDPLQATDNQTEIIYTVFVNGIPVLATIAANDMKLMSDAEVSKILEKTVSTKAERIVSQNTHTHTHAQALINMQTNTRYFRRGTNHTTFVDSVVLAYLKEPQATPLIPSSTMTTNQNKPILAMIFQNPYILAFIGALLLLIILLLMILMLITGTKNKRQATRKG